MRAYGESLNGQSNVVSSKDGPDRNPGQGTGLAVPAIVGKETPIVVSTGAVNEGKRGS